MARFNLSPRTRLALGGAVLLGLGAAGGAGAVKLTRPAIEMAPTTPTAIASLAKADGVVTIKGKVVELFGNRIVVQDATGRTMIDAGREGPGTIVQGANLTVQGRVDDGQLRASYLIDASGAVRAVGPMGRGPGAPGPHGHRGPGDRPGHDIEDRDDRPAPAACPPAGGEVSAPAPTEPPAPVTEGSPR